MDLFKNTVLESSPPAGCENSRKFVALVGCERLQFAPRFRVDDAVIAVAATLE